MTMALAPQEPVVDSDNGGTTMAKAKRLTYRVKLEVVQKPGGSIDITTSLYRILCAIRNADSSTDFVDVKGNKVILNSFKYERASFDAAFGLTSVGGTRPKVWVGFEIQAGVSIGHLRKVIRNDLVKENAWLHPHLCNTWSSFDIINIGFIHHIHIETQNTKPMIPPKCFRKIWKFGLTYQGRTIGPNVRDAITEPANG